MVSVTLCRGDRSHAHSPSSIQSRPRASPSRPCNSADRTAFLAEHRGFVVAFASDVPCPAWLAERQPCSLRIAMGLSPFSPAILGSSDSSWVAPRRCYRASSVNLGGCLPVDRRLLSPHGMPREEPRGRCCRAKSRTCFLPPRRDRSTCTRDAFHDRCEDRTQCRIEDPWNRRTA